MTASAARRRRLVLAIWLAPSLVLALAVHCTYRRFRIPAPPPTAERDATAMIDSLRAMIDGRATRPIAAIADDAPNGIAVTVWLDGKSIARADALDGGASGSLAHAIELAGTELRAAPAIHDLAPDARARARIEVDIIDQRAPLAGDGGWFDELALPGVTTMLAVNPGIDGIGADPGDGPPVLLLPHELVRARLLSAHQPSEDLPELAIGADRKHILEALVKHAGPARAAAVRAASLYRFRTDAFVERPLAERPGPPLPLTRGSPPRPPLTAASLRAAALAGARYLVAHLGPNGRFVYEHDLISGHQSDPTQLAGNAYSMPRHAGVTYFLAQVYRITHEAWLREPIERSFGHLGELIASGHCGTTLPDGTDIDCVIDAGETTAHLGSTALAVVALAEYQRATGDARYLPLATKLAAFLLWMQRPDGSFRHLYDVPARAADDHAQQLYYSGEATLALARMAVVTGDLRYADAATRGLDWLVDWYDFFLGGFFFGEEHWTCITAEALADYPPAQRPKYREFCRDYGAFLREQQPAPGELPDEDDLVGAYDVTPFVLPFNTPAGSRTEAMISAYELTARAGAPDPELRAQIEATLSYLLGQQLRPDNDFDAVGDVIDGGMPASPLERTIRIDYVQHTCSAMIRASEWIAGPGLPVELH